MTAFRTRGGLPSSCDKPCFPFPPASSSQTRDFRFAQPLSANETLASCSIQRASAVLQLIDRLGIYKTFSKQLRFPCFTAALRTSNVYLLLFTSRLDGNPPLSLLFKVVVSGRLSKQPLFIRTYVADAPALQVPLKIARGTLAPATNPCLLPTPRPWQPWQPPAPPSSSAPSGQRCQAFRPFFQASAMMTLSLPAGLC